MQRIKWEYEVLTLALPLPGDLQPQLAPYGEEGWEIIHAIRGPHAVTFLFKRQKAENGSADKAK